MKKVDVSKETLHKHIASRSKEYRSQRSIANRGRKGYYCSISPVFLGKDGFKNFLLEMGYAPGEEYTVDRIDNSKGYEPENIRWATRVQQNNHTSRNIHIILWDEEYTVAEALSLFGLSRSRFNYYTLASQCKRKNGPLSYEDAFAKLLLEKYKTAEEC